MQPPNPATIGPRLFAAAPSLVVIAPAPPGSRTR